MRRQDAALLPLARDHMRRRAPVGPFALHGDLVGARPFEARLAGADAVAPRGAVLLDEVEQVLVGVDDDRAGLVRPVIIHHLRQIFRVEPRCGVARCARHGGGLDAVGCRNGDAAALHGRRGRHPHRGALRQVLIALPLMRRHADRRALQLHHPGRRQVRADHHRRPLAVSVLRGGRDDGSDQGGRCERQELCLHRTHSLPNLTVTAAGRRSGDKAWRQGLS